MSHNIKLFYGVPYINQDPILKQWMSDTDFDDYVEDYFGGVHYKIINELLVLLNKTGKVSPCESGTYLIKVSPSILLFSSRTQICSEIFLS